MTGVRKYYPDLDGLIALACLSVLFSHIYDYLNFRTPLSSMESWFYENIISGVGATGVCLFFVLSGYLITWLLIEEKERTGKIDLKLFYVKRMTRIWPLFFFVVVVGFAIVPLLSSHNTTESALDHLPWYLTFLNNFDRIATGFTGFGNDSLGVLWSVAVEEQYYLLWPLLIIVRSVRWLPLVCLSLVGFSAYYRIIYGHEEPILYYHTLSVAGDLAIGGMIAALISSYNSFRKMITQTSPTIRSVLYVISIAVLSKHKFLLSYEGNLWLGRLLVGVVFAWIISDQVLSNSGFFRLGKFAFLRYTGKISYGIYSLHIFVIIALQKFNSTFNLYPINGFIYHAEFVIIVLVTFALASLSYKYFEQFFFRFRQNKILNEKVK